jgi:subtilase family serine protease
MRKPIIPRSVTALAVVAILAGAAACSGGAGSYAPPADDRSADAVQRQILTARALPGQPTPTPVPTQAPLVSSVLCTAGVGANCHVLQNTALAPLVDALGLLIPGLHPSDLRSAYGLSPLPLLSGLLGNSTVPKGPTIAIVDAFDYPNAEHDLGVYRNRMGLGPCTTANGCFQKLNKDLKKGPYPSSNGGWTAEAALDLAMASAACPTCRIALVEADNDDLDSLAALVDALTAKGSPVVPAAISNSYGVRESSDFVAMDAHFNHPGFPIVASAGDERAVEFPASSSHVIAVGGTTLQRQLLSARGWSESPWASSGNGCSAYFAAGSWQHAGCGKRSVADLAVVADLNPGIAVYNSAAGGWVVYGGTSAGAPFVAGLFAAANDYPASGDGAAPMYAKAAHLNALAGAAASIALGTPNGLGAF